MRQAISAGERLRYLASGMCAVCQYVILCEHWGPRLGTRQYVEYMLEI